MVKKQKAFTLVETIISMMIIMIVAVGSLTSLTKTKPRIESVTLRGQYGCWIWDSSAASSLGIPTPSGVSNGDLVEWYFDERTERTNEPIPVPAGQSCILKLDQRPAHYYILASGAGNMENPGQVSTSYTPAISNELTINLGNTSTFDLTTTVINGDQPITAGGALPVGSKFHPVNIKSCNILKDTTSNKIKSCEVVKVNMYDEVNDTYSDTYKIRLNGLETVDAYGNPQVELLNFSSLSFKGGIPSTYNVDFNNIPLGSAAMTMISANHSDSYMVSGVGKGYDASELTFEHWSSSYVPSENILNYYSFPNNTYSTSDRSKMTKIIENISVRRRSKLTELFKLLNAGGLSKNGAVLIMW